MTGRSREDQDTPNDQAGAPQPPVDEAGGVPSKSGRSRRGELEAQQKRYMDQRFGRDRPMTRKPSS
jgi:hypothetical protein